jgi:tetratricopeptide (TPR) repeat protein
MKIKPLLSIVLLASLLALVVCSGRAIAQSNPPPVKPSTPTELKAPSPYTNSFWEKLERLREDKQLQDLVEEDLEKSITIRTQIQAEVDRAFNHTTTLINVLLAILTAIPVLMAVGIWFIRRSVINQILSETKQQLKIERQFEQEVAAEFKTQIETFKQEIGNLRSDFNDQLAQLKTLFLDLQTEKDKIIQELAQITPSPIRESAPPETQEKIHALTQKLEQLTSINAQISFTANDYIEQAKALYFEGRYEDAIALYDKAIQEEPEHPRAWCGRGATLSKLQNTEAALSAYEKSLQLKPDYLEAWFGKGTALAKLQQLVAAIAAYEQAIHLKSDFLLAWFGKARCHALQNQIEATIVSLQHAIELNPDKAKELIRTDTSFDVLRSQEQFQQLLTTLAKGT